MCYIRFSGRHQNASAVRLPLNKISFIHYGGCVRELPLKASLHSQSQAWHQRLLHNLFFSLSLPAHSFSRSLPSSIPPPSLALLLPPSLPPPLFPLSLSLSLSTRPLPPSLPPSPPPPSLSSPPPPSLPPSSLSLSLAPSLSLPPSSLS